MNATMPLGEAIPLTLVSLGMFFVIGWGLWIASQAGARKAKLKAISEMQNKLLDRFASAGDLGQFLASETGRRFLDSFDTVRSVSTGRIVGAAQVGVVLTFLGLGLLALGLFYTFREPVLPIMGVILLSLGLGFLVSSFVAHRLTKSLPREGSGGDHLTSDVA